MRKSIGNKKKKLIFLKFEGKCAYCGCQLDDDLLEIDHLTPFSKGGECNLDNLVPACHYCNSYKSNKSLDEFRGDIKNFKNKHELRGVGYHVKIAKNYNILNGGKFDGLFHFEKSEG